MSHSIIVGTSSRLQKTSTLLSGLSEYGSLSGRCGAVAATETGCLTIMIDVIYNHTLDELPIAYSCPSIFYAAQGHCWKQALCYLACCLDMQATIVMYTI